MEFIKLSSGKEVYCNNGIIGISPDLELSEGYDGSIYSYEEYVETEPDVDPGYSWVLTKAERLELCDLIITRWEKLRTSLKGD